MRRQLASVIQPRRATFFSPVHYFEVARAAKLGSSLTDQQNKVSFILEKLASYEPLLRDQSDHSNRWRRVDGALWVLIIQTYVSACDRRPEPKAGLGQTLYRFAKLPEILRAIGIPKVQIVRHCQRRGARANQVPGGFGNCNPGPFSRIETAIEAVTVRRGRKKFPRFADVEYPGIGTGRHDRPGPHRVIILPVDPVLRCNRGIAQEFQQRFP